MPAAYAELVLAMTLRAQREPGPEAAALAAAMRIAEGAENPVLTTQALRCLARPRHGNPGLPIFATPHLRLNHRRCALTR